MEADQKDLIATKPDDLPARHGGLADFAMTIQDVLRQAQLIQQVMAAVMRDGEHYGVIPGTKGKKSLLKPGAEKLCFVFGLSNKLEIEAENLPNGHREYRIIANLYDRAGTMRGQGVGSASTMESKHRYRGAAGRACPECGAMAVKASKKEYGGGYYCDGKSGGCGAKWRPGTPEAKQLDAMPAVRAENPDPADQYNTVLKMAKKRALVDAVLTATAASDIFTQDIEDLEDRLAEQEREAVRKPLQMDEPDQPAVDGDIKGDIDALAKELGAIHKPAARAAWRASQLPAERIDNLRILKEVWTTQVAKSDEQSVLDWLDWLTSECGDKPTPEQAAAVMAEIRGVPEPKEAQQ